MKMYLGAAAMVLVAVVVQPASAAKMTGGCSGANLGKTEAMIEAMAEGPAKMMAQQEIATAQTAMLDGKMAQCAMHLNKAMHADMMK